MRVTEISSPHTILLKNLEKKPLLSDYEVLVQVKASGICGTDVHIFEGDYVENYPIIPGHEFSGTVVETGKKVSRVDKGNRVAIEPNLSCGHCDFCSGNKQHMCRNWEAVGVTRSGGMAEYVAVPEKAVFEIGSLSFEQAAFMEPLSCVLHGLELAKVSLGDKVIILGAGPIGVLFVRSLRAYGATEVDVVARNPGRKSFMEQERCRVFSDISEVPRQHYDLVIDATGAPLIEEIAPYLARPTGTVLLFGVPPQKQKIAIEPFYFFKNEITLFSSFTSLCNSLPALKMLQSLTISVDDLISHKLHMKEFERGISLMREKKEETLMKVMLYPDK